MDLGERTSGVCPICNHGRLLTKEHVVPGWLMRALAKLGYEDFSEVLMLVCSPCNARMGREFENQTSQLLPRILAGRPTYLPRRQQTLLSSWLFKSNMLLLLRDYDNPASGRTRLDQRRDAARLAGLVVARKKPPTTACIRIGQWEPEFDREDQARRADQSIMPPLQDVNPPITLYNTGVLGGLFYEIVILTSNGDAVAFEKRRSRAGNDLWLTQIWPPLDDGAAWPPRKSISRYEMAKLNLIWRSALVEARPNLPLPPLLPHTIAVG